MDMNDFDMDGEYTDSDFNSMLIELYRNGEPYLDSYEYYSALYHNDAVEDLRKAYFERKAERGK